MSRDPSNATDGIPRRGHNENVAVSTDVRPFRATRAAGYVGAFFAGGLALERACTQRLVWACRARSVP